ncbi:MAG: LysM peptidoglycan-binding domain-containing protein [Rikenellaceae bacterium]
MLKRFFAILLLSIFTLSLSYANDVDQKKRRVKGCVTHVVNFGEDVSSLMRRYEISISDLEQYNPMIRNGIKIGELIYVPQKRIGSATADQIENDLAAMGKNSPREVKKVEKVVEKPIVPQKVAPKIGGDFVEHTVKKGETFYSISRSYGVTVESIHQNNPDIAQDDMRIGTVLKIYLNGDTPHVAVSKADEVPVSSPAVSAVEPAPIALAPVRKVDKFEGVGSAIKVSLLLPLKSSNASTRQFTEFYNGFLVGLDSLKNEGVTVALNVITTDKSLESIDRILQSGELDNSDMIVGPVYDSQFCQVAKYAGDRAIPIVSPLASVSCNNKYIFQVAPDDDTKYDKLKNALLDKNVILFSSSNDDAEFLAKMKEFSGGNINIVPFNAKAKADSYVSDLESKRENVFLVAAQDQQTADAIISKIGAIRVFSAGKVVSTITTPKVARMSNIDPANFFSANVCYVTSYHVDRTSRAVVDFDRHYLGMFGGLPTLYSYRGYDVAMFFIGSMKEFGSDFYNYIADYYTTILQVTYRFNQKNPNSLLTNKEWMYVNYTPSYDIIVK